LFDRGYANHIESEPIEILIEDPQGVDLEVWSTIKTKGAFAFFLQTGESTGHAKEPGSEEIVGVLENLIKRYSSSKYVDNFRASIAERRQ
jgi:hypothetical protein